MSGVFFLGKSILNIVYKTTTMFYGQFKYNIFDRLYLIDFKFGDIEYSVYFI